MNTIPDLIPLHDNRPGLRALLEVEIREPLATSAEEGADEATTCPMAALDFIASTATLDRYHEIIEPAGWRLDSYRRNPVFQNAHNYGDILFTLGKALSTEVRTIGNGAALCQRIQFATEVNPVARIAYGLYKGGFLNAVSVGFIPLRWEDGGNGSGEARQSCPCSAAPVSRTGVAGSVGCGDPGESRCFGVGVEIGCHRQVGSAGNPGTFTWADGGCARVGGRLTRLRLTTARQASAPTTITGSRLHASFGASCRKHERRLTQTGSRATGQQHRKVINQ